VAGISFRGGARIGWVNASWPFAKLTTTAEHLTISSLGNYDFSPAQVSSIERYGSIPLLASGIRVNHNRADYPAKIVFWCMGNREKVLAQIDKSGFIPKGQVTVRAAGFPIRWSVVLAFIVLWNALFMLDGSFSFHQHQEPGPLVLLALLLVLAFSTAVKSSVPLQQRVLRKGHDVGEIKAFLVLLQIVTGFLSALFGAFLLAHAYAG
jgi:hypothetical protein